MVVKPAAPPDHIGRKQAIPWRSTETDDAAEHYHDRKTPFMTPLMAIFEKCGVARQSNMLQFSVMLARPRQHAALLTR
jgi:hypothetical protein